MIIASWIPFLTAILLGPIAPASAAGGDVREFDLHAAGKDVREFDLRAAVRVRDIPADAAEAVVWVAVPQELDEQRVTALGVTSAHPWVLVEDPDFGNRMLRIAVNDPPSELVIEFEAQVRRFAVSSPRSHRLTAAQRELFLREEALVSLSPRVRSLASEIGEDDRARYDFVLSAMDYDKSVAGYGLGDTERACDVGKGNCTDFHSLFMSLSRAMDVPAVFEMGYSTKPEGQRDRVGGYHCWAWFHRDGAWTPVDISEADKAPEKADFFFGHLDADRITFSRGRDVRLPGMRGAPLNYLPSGAYVEIDGEPHDRVERSLTYDVDAPRPGRS